jgi:hypothetical protein
MPVLSSRVPVRRNPTARSNPFLGIALTKEQKHAKSVQKKTLYKTKYEKCKTAKEAKGHTVYPDEGGKKCKSKYKKWQKHRGKVGERALKLTDKLDKKGKLSPELRADLDKNIADAEDETQIDPELTDSELAMMEIDLSGEEDTITDESDNTLMYAAGAVVVLGLAVGGVLLLSR